MHLFTQRRLSRLLLSLLPLFCFTALHSQGISADEIKAQLIRDWERAESYTLDYLSTMPADKYALKANDSTRTFAQQMLHLSQGNIYLASNAVEQKPIMLDRMLEHVPTAQSKDSVTYFVKSSYDWVLDGIKNLDASKLGDKVKRNAGNREETRYAWLLKAFEHQTHHRGQTTIYIRLAGLRPPNERLF